MFSDSFVCCHNDELGTFFTRAFQMCLCKGWWNLCKKDSSASIIEVIELKREKMRRKNAFSFLFGLFVWAAVDFLCQKYCEIENSNAPCYPHLVFAACLVHMLLDNITRTNAQSISRKNLTKLHLFWKNTFRKQKFEPISFSTRKLIQSANIFAAWHYPWRQLFFYMPQKLLTHFNQSLPSCA